MAHARYIVRYAKQVVYDLLTEAMNTDHVERIARLCHQDRNATSIAIQEALKTMLARLKMKL